MNRYFLITKEKFSLIIDQNLVILTFLHRIVNEKFMEVINITEVHKRITI